MNIFAAGHLGILAAVVVVLLLAECAIAGALFAQARRTRRLGFRLDEVFGKGEGPDWEKLAHDLMGHVQADEARLAAVEALARATRARLAEAITRIGVVRYSAYPGEGPDLSFSLAMVDEAGTGVVLTGLYGREDTRLYLKPLKNSTSTFALSDEEKHALASAMEGATR